MKNYTSTAIKQRKSTAENTLELTTKQLKSIGYNILEQIPSKYWNKQLSDCFKHHNSEGQNKKYLQNQTFKQFTEMDLTGPNKKGTGRFQFKEISQIKFSLIQKRKINPNSNKPFQKLKPHKDSKKQKLKSKKLSKESPLPLIDEPQKDKEAQLGDKDFKLTPQLQFSLNAISQLLTIFFQIPASHNSSINLSIDESTNNLADQKEIIEFNLEQKGFERSKKAKLLPRPFFDVWKLIDVGIEYKNLNKNQIKPTKKESPKQSIYLFLIEADLQQNDYQIDGRATGDGVVFISFKKQDFYPIDLQKQFLTQSFPCYTLPIMIHECLHTLGFDHCSAWECLMNSITNEEFLLCPCCVRKIQSQIHPKTNLKQWYSQLAQTLKNIKSQMVQNYGTQKCIRMFEDLLYSKSQIKQRKKTHQKGGDEKTNLIEIQQGSKQQKKGKEEQMDSKPTSMLQKCLHIHGSLNQKQIQLKKI